MVNIIIIAWVSLFFAGYVFFDGLAALSRMAAAKASLNAFGAAIEKIMNTIKRLSIFSFPPAIGYFVMRQDASSLFLAVFGSLFLGASAAMFIFLRRIAIQRYFFLVALNFDSGQGIFRAFISACRGSQSGQKVQSPPNVTVSLPEAMRHNLQLFLLASWVYLVFGSSIFLVNILAMVFFEAAPVILQTLGFFNGLGTLVLAFFVDPRIARFLDKKEKLEELTLVVIAAQGVSVGLYSPFLFGAVFLVFF